MKISKGTILKYGYEGNEETYKVLYTTKLGGVYMYICKDHKGVKWTFARSSVLDALETGVFTI